jgi:hypothetical protein
VNNKSVKITDMLDTPTKYCEQLLQVSIEPINTITNIAFICFALLAFYKLRQEPGGIKFILPLLLAFIGFGSAWWHMGHTAAGDIADTLSIVIFASTVSVVLLHKLFASKLKVILAFVPLLVLAFVTEQLPYLNGSLPYVVLLGGLTAFGFLFVKRFPESKALVITSVSTFGLAILFRSLDMQLCSQVTIGTHFLWHLFVALCCYQLILLATSKYRRNFRV